MNLKLIFRFFGGLQLLTVVIEIAAPEETVTSFSIKYSPSMLIKTTINCYSTDGCFDCLGACPIGLVTVLTKQFQLILLWHCYQYL
jgi:hypothetical protein